MLNSLITIVDTLSLWLGRALAWLTLAMVVIMTSVVVLRYGWGQGSVFLQDLVTYCYAAVFLLGAAYALRQDGHVRVDIFYRRFSPAQQAWVNLIGTLACLLPFCGFVAWISWDYVTLSWRIRESSPEPGGIPAVFLLKTGIPAMACTLALQGIAEALRALQQLRDQPLPANHPPHPQGEVL